MFWEVGTMRLEPRNDSLARYAKATLILVLTFSLPFRVWAQDEPFDPLEAFNANEPAFSQTSHM